MQLLAEKQAPAWVIVDGLEVVSEMAIEAFELMTGRPAPKRLMVSKFGTLLPVDLVSHGSSLAFGSVSEGQVKDCLRLLPRKHVSAHETMAKVGRNADNKLGREMCVGGLGKSNNEARENGKMWI